MLPSAFLFLGRRKASALADDGLLWNPDTSCGRIEEGFEGTGKETSLGERLMGVYLPTLFEFSGVEGQGGAENYLSGCGAGRCDCLGKRRRRVLFDGWRQHQPVSVWHLPDTSLCEEQRDFQDYRSFYYTYGRRPLQWNCTDSGGADCTYDFCEDTETDFTGLEEPSKGIPGFGGTGEESGDFCRISEKRRCDGLGRAEAAFFTTRTGKFL